MEVEQKLENNNGSELVHSCSAAGLLSRCAMVIRRNCWKAEKMLLNWIYYARLYLFTLVFILYLCESLKRIKVNMFK